MTQRPIKFRAWDSGHKWMCPVLQMTWEYGNIHEVLIAYPLKTAPAVQWYYARGSAYSLDLLALMQFTGLHDKNGKEIWEGDVVRYYDSTTMWLTGEVRFDGGEFQIPTAENPIGLNGFVHGYVYNGEPIVELEVIGNVWENPELIKKT